MQSKNYIIHGDTEQDVDIECNFFAELKKMLNHSEKDDNTHTSHNESENQDHCCLLTKEPLQTIHIVLACGHKFNYVPIYREVIAQKTIGLSSTGYYTSHSLKRNEIKCPYCRNVQDKLLPYLEFDGVKKMVNVNYPLKMSMTGEPCMYVHHSASSKKGKKNTSCKEFAINCHNGTYVCKKHYELSTTTTTTTTHLDEDKNTDASPSSSFSSISKCGVILRYGKNKGTPCPNPSSCRVHKNNQVVE